MTAVESKVTGTLNMLFKPIPGDLYTPPLTPHNPHLAYQLYLPLMNLWNRDEPI